MRRQKAKDRSENHSSVLTHPITDSPATLRLVLVCPENLSPRELALANALAATTDLRIVVRSPGGSATPAPTGARVFKLSALDTLRRGWQPDGVLYASPPSAALHWKVWRWKRRHAPGALLGGPWRLPTDTVRSGWRRWTLESLDFCLADDEVTAGVLGRAGMARGRVRVNDDAEPLAEFLARRCRAEARSVLWVDEDISLHSPSTKHLVYSIPHLQAQGWEIRGWCLSADDAARAGMETREFPPAPRWLRLLTPYWFFASVNLYGVRQTILKGRPPAQVVHTVGGSFLGADAVSVQFVNHVWLHKQIELRPHNLRDVAKLLMTLPAVCKDQFQFSNPRCRLFLPASDSIGEEVCRRCLPGTAIRTLANSYDESRFNAAVRQQWHEPTRRELGFGPEHTVFSFASQGHYKRKGFWLAVKALAALRRRGGPKADGVRFLVIGGQPDTLAQLQGQLAGPCPDWQAWTVFVGHQPAVERYLSAADAFLFPSYFEAFCLAEIEAGALGLPLLLTPHHGTEMILQDGVNGRRLSFDPARMTEELADFLADGLPPFAASAGRGLDRPEYARELAEVYRSLT